MTNVFLPRPRPAAKVPNDRLNPDGSENLDRVPHELLLMNPEPLSLQEQIRRMTAASARRREAFYDFLDEDDMGEWIDDSLSEPLTPYEIDALRERIDAKDRAGPVSGDKTPSQPAPAKPDPEPVG